MDHGMDNPGRRMMEWTMAWTMGNHGRGMLYHAKFSLCQTNFRLYHAKFRLCQANFRLCPSWSGTTQIWHGTTESWHGTVARWHGLCHLRLVMVDPIPPMNVKAIGPIVAAYI